MKRRLAMLLALSLTFASFSVTGVSAAEENAAGTQVVAETQVEETTETAEEAVEETTEEAAEETTEAAVEETTEEAAEETTEEAAEETTEEPTETAVEETTEEAAEETTEAATEEAAEDTTEEITEEAAPAEEVSNEAADAVEEVITAEDAKVTEEVVEKKAAEKLSGWQNNYTTYYVNGVQAKNQWVTAKAKNGKTYTFYFGSDGKMYKGWKRVNGKMYFFADNRYTALPAGVRLTGFKTISGYTFYFADSRISGHPTGEQITGWAKISGKTYYFADSRYPSRPLGARLTGFKTISGVTYYFADSRYTAAKVAKGVMLTGWKTIKGKLYYFADNRYPKATRGKMLTGIKTIKGKCYFFDKFGRRRTGWVRTSKNVWGYYTSKGYAGKAGWKKKDGDSWYYITKNGRAKTGWITLGSSKFYLDGSNGGKMVVGPHKFASGRIYFFDLDGRLAKTKGWKYHVDGSYYTYASGRVAVNTTIDGIKVGADGKAAMSVMDMKAQKYSSSTDYLILVDKSTYSVCVYKGKRGAWVKVKGVWRCTHGGSNTPNGEWHTAGHLTKHSAEYGWGDFTYTSAAYCTHISAGNFFHSILFDKYSRTNPYNLSPVDPNLGKDYSHGCIRLVLDNAKWIWDNIPTNTKVVVYNS